MRRVIFVLAGTFVALLVFAGCSGADEIEIQGFDDEIITISTEDLNEDQISLLEQLANGEIEMMDLAASDVFTNEELADLGLASNMDNLPGEMGEGMDREKKDSGEMMENFDLADVDLDSLNFEGKSDEIADAITKAIEEGMTAQELIDEGVVTMDDLMDVGVLQNDEMMPGGSDGEGEREPGEGEGNPGEGKQGGQGQPPENEEENENENED